MSHPSNARTGTVVQFYLSQIGLDFLHQGTAQDYGHEEAAADIITDLMHWLASNGCNTDVFERATWNFESEVHPEYSPECAPGPFYKTTIVVEVLSEEPFHFTSLADLGDSLDNECSGSVMVIESNEELNGYDAAQALMRQGSSPEFFGLTTDGQLLNEGDYYCEECGTNLVKVYEPDGDYWKCAACGLMWDVDPDTGGICE